MNAEKEAGLGFLKNIWRSSHLIVLLSLCDGCCENSGVFFRQDEGMKGYRLGHNVLRNVTAVSVLDCGLECLRESCCRSMNYRERPSGLEQGNCELSSSAASVNPKHLLKDEMYSHYEMLEPEKVKVLDFCCSSPCLNGGSCDAGSRSCRCRAGFGGRTCSETHVLGETKDFPGNTCNNIKSHSNTSTSKMYWINPKVQGNTTVFQAYCDMTTDRGGWTLVYRYNFTNYTHFYHSSNAVTPRPNWPADEANVTISVTPPLNTSFGAVNFNLWKHIGGEFLVKSNINDWFVCRPDNGSLVLKRNGRVRCKHLKSVVEACSNGTSIPYHIEWLEYGPVLKGPNTIYHFDGSTSFSYPTHDPCQGTKRRNHKTGVSQPMGAIYLR